MTKCEHIFHAGYYEIPCQLRKNHLGAHKGRPVGKQSALEYIWINMLWSNEGAMQEVTEIYRPHMVALFMITIFILGILLGKVI